MSVRRMNKDEVPRQVYLMSPDGGMEIAYHCKADNDLMAADKAKKAFPRRTINIIEHPPTNIASTACGAAPQGCQ